MSRQLGSAPQARTGYLEKAPGEPFPLGAHPRDDGVNFAIFRRHARGVALLLFDAPDDGVPSARIDLDPATHRTGDVWHAWIKGRPRVYAFSVDGPYPPAGGDRFNRHRILLDPYARALVATSTWDYSRSLGYDPAAPERDLSFSREQDARSAAKCLVTGGDFD